MRSNILAIGLMTFLAEPAFAEFSLPPEASGLTFGMSKDALLDARTAIKRKSGLGGAVDLSKSELLLFEDLKLSESIFSAATYGIENNELKSLVLTGYPQQGAERATRRKAIKNARLLWGAAHKRMVPEDVVRKGRGIAAFSWAVENYEIILMLPTTREVGDLKVAPVSLIIRPNSPKNKPMRDADLAQAEKEALLKSNDADDMEIQK